MLINGKEMDYRLSEMVYTDSFDESKWGECTHILAIWPIGERRKTEEETKTDET